MMNGRFSKGSMNFVGPLSSWANWAVGRDGSSNPSPLDAPLKKPEAPVMSLSMQLWFGARLPFCAFIIIAGAFTYTYHAFPILPWFLVVLALDFALLVTWPAKEIGTARRKAWDWAPMASWILAVSCAIGFGLSNYAVIEGWVNTTFLKEYNSVNFDTDPRSVRDAGVLNFAIDTALDTTKSAGYKFWLDKYCAAPVVKRGDSTAAPVGFWAVGLGCCENRGGFSCGDAGISGANSGVPVRHQKFGVFHTAPEKEAAYHSAVKMAAAAHGLEVANEVVFVTWAKDAHSVGTAAWWSATTFFFAMTLFGLCACMGCQAGFTHISAMQR